jgi:regulator of replication initiation timing|tara:strand:+ start:131 stop:337 length:207 start_codon:yes stop_codon:yes gene_type:complete
MSSKIKVSGRYVDQYEVFSVTLTDQHLSVNFSMTQEDLLEVKAAIDSMLLENESLDMMQQLRELTQND